MHNISFVVQQCTCATNNRLPYKINKEFKQAHTLYKLWYGLFVLMWKRQLYRSLMIVLVCMKNSIVIVLVAVRQEKKNTGLAEQ